MSSFIVKIECRDEAYANHFKIMSKGYLTTNKISNT